jgi:3-(3-hydroxy-phenyl)propionate hydroxylase/flavoprotein hydroxylase
VLLAGDAAHQMPPFAGQGMCSGLRDAANLAWKLGLVLSGHAGPALLDVYQAERHGNVRAVIDLSMALGQVICITDPEEAAARDASMAGGVEPGRAQALPPLPGITAGIVRAGDPLAGGLFVQGRVATDGGPALFDEVEGAGWRLVATDAAPPPALPPDLAAWFAQVGGRVVVVPAADDVDGTYRGWFAAHGVGAVLQRPDFHVFGATDASGAADLVADLRRMLDRTSDLAPTTPGGTP